MIPEHKDCLNDAKCQVERGSGTMRSTMNQRDLAANQQLMQKCKMKSILHNTAVQNRKKRRKKGKSRMNRELSLT